MFFDDMLSSFFEWLGYNLPAILVLIVAICTIHAQWHRHPPAARWALLAFIWILGTYFLNTFWGTIGVFLVFGPGRMLEREAPILLTLSCFEGLGYIFILLALNAACKPYRPRTYFDEFPEDEPPPGTWKKD